MVHWKGVVKSTRRESDILGVPALKLVFDIGFHVGEDSAYYLSRGVAGLPFFRFFAVHRLSP